MDQLAELVHLSHVGLLWKFKHSTGTTLTEYLTGLRMKYAKELLLAGNLSVSQVADLCGYSNPYYFSNVFHNHFGVSPSKYRDTVLPP